MLNIVVINCDDKYIEYEWNSIEEFVNDMESDNEIIPMLDDVLAEVNTQNEELQTWWEGDVLSVYELLEKCKQIEKDRLVAVNLSILHWDNGCKQCPLIEECKKADSIKDKECQDIWYDWLKSIRDE